MYSPKIDEELIQKLYQIGQARKKPMTRVVNEFLKKSIEEIEGMVNKVRGEADADS